MNGKFIISLDCELMWGVRDSKTINTYGNNIVNVHKTLPKVLDIFNMFNINATFAIVGFLFAKHKNELKKYLPNIKPNYIDKKLNPYDDYLNTIGENQNEDPYHYGPNIISNILKQNRHEICTHTFSHFYCLEPGQDINAFAEDLKSAILISKSYNIAIKSIVFPRNQHNKLYNTILIAQGIKIYRGTEKAWYYTSKNGTDDNFLRRAFRLLDSYINLSGHNCFEINKSNTEPLINIPSSRFLRPYNKKLKALETFRLSRIKRSMTYAARHNLCFHLWWHPHNFGSHELENFSFLESILKHFQVLNKTYGFESCSMQGAVNF